MQITTKAWDKRFKKEGKIFEEPHEDLPRIASLLKEQGAKRLLDLGSGTGRHVVYLAKRGFSVFGLDNSPAGIRIAKSCISSEGLKADLQVQDMTEIFPYRKEFSMAS